MEQIDFKAVKRVSQKQKDIVYGYMRRTQSMFPSDNTYYTIVQLVQDLCLLYFRTIIDTKILTEEEQFKLLEMVDKQSNNEHNCYEWKLLFRASRDGYGKTEFYKHCNHKNNIV